MLLPVGPEGDLEVLPVNLEVDVEVEPRFACLTSGSSEVRLYSRPSSGVHHTRLRAPESTFNHHQEKNQEKNKEKQHLLEQHKQWDKSVEPNSMVGENVYHLQFTTQTSQGLIIDAI